MTILDLPDELLVRVFLCLHVPADLASAACACRRFAAKEAPIGEITTFKHNEEQGEATEQTHQESGARQQASSVRDVHRISLPAVAARFLATAEHPLSLHPGETWILALRFVRLREEASRAPFSAAACKISQVALGDGITAVVTAEGAVFTCGYNYLCKLGHADGEDRRVGCPVRELAKWRLVYASCGSFHTLFVSACGKVWASGGNASGQLGLASAAEHVSSRPILVHTIADKVAVQAVAGHLHSAVLTAEGEVWTWGDNTRGQLGVGDDCALSRTPVLAVPAAPSQGHSVYGKVGILAMGMNHSVAVMSDTGLVAVWGDNRHGQLGLGDRRTRYKPELLPELEKVVQCAAGAFHTALLTATGRVLCMGSHKFGQLGVGTRTSASFLAVAEEVVWDLSWGRATQVCCGNFHTMAATEHGQAFCWGGNNCFQLGRQTRGASIASLPEHLCLGVSRQHFKVIRVAAGALHSAVLTRCGRVLTFGRGAYGSLGLGPDLQISPYPSPMHMCNCAANCKGVCQPGAPMYEEPSTFGSP